MTLHSEPRGRVYRVLTTIEFGETIELPAPLNLTIDTAEFPIP
ncbi:hypothetical protein [Streptomyces sp. NPDC050264]